MPPKSFCLTFRGHFILCLSGQFGKIVIMLSLIHISLEKVIAFGKSTGVTYPLGMDPGADIFAKYALRKAGITRNVLIDKEGRIVKLTRLYNRSRVQTQRIGDVYKRQMPINENFLI